MRRNGLAQMKTGDWSILFERSVDAHARGDGDVARITTELLLSRRDLPLEVRAATLRNSVTSTRRLQELAPEADFINVEVPTPPGRTAFNPSIHSSRQGLIMSVRSTNWEFTHGRHYRVNAADGIPRSANYLLRLSAALKTESVVLVEDETDRTGEVAAQFRGYHDLRLFEYGGRLRAVAHTLDFSPSGLHQMALLDVVDHRLMNLRILSDGVTRAEKNWSPAIWNGELFFIHSFAPMTLLRWDGARLLAAGLESYVGPPIAADFRGGSQLVPIERGYLTVVHASADFADNARVYLHRFVSLDEEFRITGVSPQFLFQKAGIEFAAGLAIRDGTAIVSFGIDDTACWLVRLPLARVMAMVSPPIDVTLEELPGSRHPSRPVAAGA